MPHKYQCFVLADTVVFISFEVGFEVAIITILKHKIEVFLVSETVIELDNEGTGKGLEIGDLIFDLFLDRFSNFVDANTFYCNTDSIFAYSEIYLSSCSLPQAN